MHLRSCSLWRVAVGPAGVSRALHACHPGRSPPQHSTAQHGAAQPSSPAQLVPKPLVERQHAALVQMVCAQWHIIHMLLKM